ncbi:MAG: TRAP transporter large permease [Clostridiales bacterium]|nr:TRAP transporter large permease [Clostridiales bacterium]
MLIVFLAFIAFLVIGMPIAYAIGISGSLYFLQHLNLPATIMVQMPLTQAQNFALLAVPLFIFAGNLLNCGGTTERLAKFSGILTGRMRGGYAQTSVVLSTMMGGVSGSAIADAAMEARLLGDQMKKAGYAKGFIACNIAFTGLITATIPPGNALIIYGTAGNVSIGRLFTTGMVVGLFMMIIMMLTTWGISTLRGYKPVRTNRVTSKEFWSAFKECVWALLFPIMLLIGIRMGLFTPSEVGAFACVYAALVGVFVYKELNLRTFLKALEDTAKDVGAVMFIIAMSALFGYGVPLDRVPQTVAGFMLSITETPSIILLLIILMLTVIGMFMEGAATILILTPILLPIIKQIGIDPVHFGMIMCTVVTLSNCTPPVGLSMYTVNSIIGCSLGEYAKEMLPWLLTFLFAMAVLAFFPAPFMWLQGVLY